MQLHVPCGDGAGLGAAAWVAVLCLLAGGSPAQCCSLRGVPGTQGPPVEQRNIRGAVLGQDQPPRFLPGTIQFHLPEQTLSLLQQKAVGPQAAASHPSGGNMSFGGQSELKTLPLLSLTGLPCLTAVFWPLCSVCPGPASRGLCPGAPRHPRTDTAGAVLAEEGDLRGVHAAVPRGPTAMWRPVWRLAWLGRLGPAGPSVDEVAPWLESQARFPCPVLGLPGLLREQPWLLKGLVQTAPPLQIAACHCGLSVQSVFKKQSKDSLLHKEERNPPETGLLPTKQAPCVTSWEPPPLTSSTSGCSGLGKGSCGRTHRYRHASPSPSLKSVEKLCPTYI